MKDKKIGIITWHYYPNYGSALQAYALFKVISEKLSYECKVINYRSYKYSPKGIMKVLKNNNITYKIICTIFNKKRAYKFYNFINNNLSMTREYNNTDDLRELNYLFNTFICGSDQIWAPNVIDSTYLLDFVNDLNKRVSYAPSIVIEPNNKKQIEMYKDNLKRFNKISVREKKGEEIIKKIANLECEVVLDPTLLLKKKDYSKIEASVLKKDKYILCYLLGDNQEHIEYINKVKKQLNLKVIAIMNDKNDLSYGDDNIYTAGPEEFLSYIKGSNLVLTDSFHGMNFSIIYEKEFYVFERFKRNSPICQNDRISNLLKRLHIENRIITNLDKCIDCEKIDYKSVTRELELEREKSILYLKKALED